MLNEQLGIQKRKESNISTSATLHLAQGADRIRQRRGRLTNNSEKKLVDVGLFGNRLR